MLHCFQLCQGIADFLLSRGWGDDFEIQAAWAIPYEPEQLLGTQILISPDQVQEQDFLDRQRRVSQRLSVSLLLQRKPPDLLPETLLSLASLQSEIHDLLRRAGMIESAGLQFYYDSGGTSGFVREHLEQYRIYTGYLDLQYLLLRD